MMKKTFDLTCFVPLTLIPRISPHSLSREEKVLRTKLKFVVLSEENKYRYHSIAFGFCFCLFAFMLSIILHEHLKFVFRPAALYKQSVEYQEEN